ncbi:hypothetical protein AB0H98_26155 [Nocardia salmonicida]|uniref:hypothetical protein n=1 Tax=Nocardia salmonicida TaxID=53431 RepID=UPI003410BA56
MARAFDLERSSREFANELTQLLNRTICKGVRLSAVYDAQKQFTVIGYGINKENRDPRVGIPISRPVNSPTFLNIFILLKPDSANKFLMVDTSLVLLARDKALSQELFHYDYERDKGDGYPEAHLQICADSEHWRALGPDRALKKLHLPVGGRRFRPSLEDIIEFLIVENFAEGLDGWKVAVDEGREAFQMKQLRAAVRKYPDVAREVLQAEGHL